MNRNFLIAQISDLHIKAGGRRSYGVVDTLGSLRKVISRLNALEPRPDIVLISGDLVDFGTAEEYATLREALLELLMPFYLVAGNHDDCDQLRKAFADHYYLPKRGRLHWTVDNLPLRLIGLDSTIPGEHGGLIEREQLDWLQARLAEKPTQPTLVMLHHPPLKSGIGHMDRLGLEGTDALEQVLARHNQIERVLCGHLHRPIQKRFGGTMICVCPGTSHQVVLDLRDDAPSRFALEPAGYLLHLWDPIHGLVTHQAVMGDYPGPYPFFDGNQLID
jgi:3',5'-cyclic AMP phosphodiesterase CpdA